VHLCYLDESGTPELSGDTSHFVLLGLSIDSKTWKDKDRQIVDIKKKYGLENDEVHTAWMARLYHEQNKVANFLTLDRISRRRETQKVRDSMLIAKAALSGASSVISDRKNYKKTQSYIHLSHAERSACLAELVALISSWKDCVLFAECTDKRSFNGKAPRIPPFNEAFTQVVTRFHRYLVRCVPQPQGMLIQDQNDTVAKRLTTLMRDFHDNGTKWLQAIPQIVETPLFVNSEYTSMVQMADLCAFAVRRYCEFGETALFNPLLPKFAIDQRNSTTNYLVGIRHYTGTKTCACKICAGRIKFVLSERGDR
jgi:hypothetical protein